MSLGTILARKTVTAAPGNSLADVARRMQEENVGAIVVTRDDRPLGIITDRDLALAVCVRGVSPEEPVQNVMTCPVSTIREDEGIFDATRQMMETAVRRLPVVDKYKRLKGLISLDDLLLLLSRELSNLSGGVRAEMTAERT